MGSKSAETGSGRLSHRRAVWLYLLAIVGPTLALLFLGLQSVRRQLQAVTSLTASNMRLSGERLAAELERRVSQLAEACLRDKEIVRIQDSILASGRDERGSGGLYRIDAETGDVSPVVQSGGLRFPWECAWSPDGRTIYYEMSAGIVARDAGTGQERTIHPDARHFAPSPDGRFLAVGREDPPTKSGVLEIIALDTGQSGELLRVPDPSFFYKVLSWSADGRFLLYGNGELWRVAVENGESEKLGIAMPGLLQVRVHPNGRRIAFFAW